MKPNKTLYLIDGSGYIYRSFHALPMLTNSQRMPTNAILGFTNILVKLLKEKDPDYIGICFDAKGPTFRHELYPDYKANRPPMPDELISQLPYVRQITAGYNIPVIERSGFEADDLMGTLAVRAEKQGFDVIMVTGDKDFMQLITDHIIMLDPVKDKVFGINDVIEKVGVSPDLITDIMALTGDTSDNVPGVPGIGKKTAPTLINQYGSLEKLYDNLGSVTAKKQKENLVNHRDNAFLSKQLVTIETDVDMPFDPDFFARKEPNADALKALFSELEFKKYLREIDAGASGPAKNYTGIYTKQALTDLIRLIETMKRVSVDTETTSPEPARASLVGLSFAVKDNEGFYIPCCHDYPDVPEQLALDYVLETLKPILENPDIQKIGQNIKYDMIVLKRHGIDLKGLYFDTMAASYVLNPSKRNHGLDDIAMELFDHKTISFTDIVGKNKASDFRQVPVEKAVAYACEDADITFLAYKVFASMLKERGLERLFFDIEMPLVDVLATMEANGIAVDRQQLAALSEGFQAELETLEKTIYELAGETFNIKSSQQLGTILFEKLELPKQKKTKKTKGYSTDSDVLTILSQYHELPASLLRYRTIAKLKSTYSDALAALVNPETGRIHASFNQTVTVTGRLSSSNPNLQNIPIKTEEGRKIRQAFVAGPGWQFIAADYSQIELRILAHCADDDILIDAFLNDEDIHTRTAAEIFSHHVSMVTHDMRYQAKAINFGIVYGMSPYGLSKELGITQKMAKNYIDSYFARYRGVKQFIETSIANTEKSGETSTLAGRIRKLPEINSPRKAIKEFANRAAVNTQIQGTAADIIKLAMINVQKALDEKNYPARMLISVHDEIVLEAPDAIVRDVKDLVVDVMETVMTLKVPLKVNANVGRNWDEAH